MKVAPARFIASAHEGVFSEYLVNRSWPEFVRMLIDEAMVEHDGAKVLVNDIEAGAPDDQFYDAKVKVLQEEIEHHVEEEEQSGGVFSQARKGKLDLDSLGEQLAARKKELTATYKASGVPQPELTTMDDVSV